MTTRYTRIKHTRDDIERFFKYVIIKSPNECWEWTGTKHKGKRPPYGQLKINGKTTKAHRFSYCIYYGGVPKNKPFVCHTCDNPSCVNPFHLWAGTNKQNTRDKVRKGRQLRGKTHPAFLRNSDYILKGEDCPHSKMTWKEVDEIRFKYANRQTNGYTRDTLAEEYKISSQTIWLIISNKSWKTRPTDLPLPDFTTDIYIK